MPQLSTGQAITQTLIRNGIDTLFGIPGAHTYDFIDAVAQADNDIKFISSRHEQGAAYMAFGYAKATGTVGAYTVVPGPGVLNSSAALCTAYGANTPVLCITGNIMADLIGKGRGQLHELPDQLTTLRSITKWAERINSAADAPGVVTEAFRQLLSGRQGPVAVETPWDTFGARGDVTLVDPGIAARPPQPDKQNVEQAARLVQAATNPIIMVGAGAVNAGAEILRLAQQLQAPVTTHRSGKGIISDHESLSLSSLAAYEMWPQVDLVIAIGTRMELAYFRWQWQPPGLKVVRIDIDPEEINRIPSDIGIVTDAKLGTQALLDALGPQDRTDRSREMTHRKAAANAKLRYIQPQFDYLQAIRRALPEDGYFVEEVCQAGFTARMAFEVYAPRHYVTCGYQETLGFGFNTALGVKVAHPDKAVVSICGDGGFMFGMQELATAVQHHINLVTIIFNNGAYGNVYRDQADRYAGRYTGAELINPNFVELAQSFGAYGWQANNSEELYRLLAKGLNADRPVVIEVPIQRGTERSPWPLIHPQPPHPQ